MDRGTPNAPTLADPFARRLARLHARLACTSRPVVWLRALPGAGKTRLMQSLAAAPPTTGAPALLLDAPSVTELAQALTASRIEHERPARRVIVASRLADPLAGVLLQPRIYGLVDELGDADCFIAAGDIAGLGGAEELMAATGGWPMLVAAWLDGRREEIERMLPGFLQREVLPDLPHDVVTALYAALAAPLGAAALEHLFGAAGGARHPLLVAGADGVGVHGTWLREALTRLRARAHVLPRTVLRDLVELYTRYADPVRSILSLLEIGQFEQALEVYDHAGGIYFGYRHGFPALERVLERFGPEWERRVDTLYGARLMLLIKSGKPREALLRLEARYPDLPVDLRGLNLSQQPYALLTRIEISQDLDEVASPEVVASWGRLESLLPPADRLARGLLYNTMAMGFLRADALLEAKQLATEALGVYEREGSPYLVHFMWLHLCDIALRQSRVRDARAYLLLAEEALGRSALAYNSEQAIVDAFRARIAYEEGRYEDCPTDVDAMLEALLRGDSWPDLITTAASHLAYTAYWREGLKAALDRLDQCVLTLSRRHGPVQSRALALIRIRLYQMARRHAEAQTLLEEYELEPAVGRRHRAPIDLRLIRLRQQLLAPRPGTDAHALAATLAAEPGLEARARISLSILRAYAHHLAREPGAARRELGLALRTAETEHLLGVLVEDGPLLERLLPPFLAEASPGSAGLAAFGARVLHGLRALPAAPARSKALAGVSRQEHRVLACLGDGYTNKEIARALLLSESAVKFHLRNLFRKLGVQSRAALREEVRRRGLVT